MYTRTSVKEGSRPSLRAQIILLQGTIKACKVYQS